MNGLVNDLAGAMTLTPSEVCGAMSDREIKDRTREILAKRGRPEAATCSDRELVTLAKMETARL